MSGWSVKWLSTVFVWILAVQTTLGQTCCSGGVPVSANLGMPLLENRGVQVSLAYDLNRLQTLKSGTEVLDDDSRNRTTHALLAEVGYSFNRRWSVDLLASAVRQERRINQRGSTDFTSTNGLGDMTLLAKYTAINNSLMTLAVGLGAKLPTGPSDLIRPDGIALNADLQPGSGATDGIVWLNYARQGLLGSSSTTFATVVYSRKGTNNDYLGTQAYKFGDELQLTIGSSGQTLLWGSLVVPTLAVRYRHAGSDLTDGQMLPSTGGRWVFANPGLSWWINPTFSWQINGDIPLFADITGTQVTPTYRLNTGFYFRIDRN